jgi:hypothetical protein
VTARWAPSADEGSRLDLLPMTIEDWDGSSIEVDPEQLPQLLSFGTLLRRYVNRSSGAAVTVFLAAGRTGPMVESHTPDICYPQTGYQLAAPPTKRSLPAGPGGRTAEFRAATFSKTERASPVHLRVYWSFSAGADWRAPDNPRLAFAGRPRVFKLYVIRPLTQSGEPLDGDSAAAFIEALVPAIEKTCFAAP